MRLVHSVRSILIATSNILYLGNSKAGMVEGHAFLERFDGIGQMGEGSAPEFSCSVSIIENFCICMARRSCTTGFRGMTVKLERGR